MFGKKKDTEHSSVGVSSGSGKGPEFEPHAAPRRGASAPPRQPGIALSAGTLADAPRRQPPAPQPQQRSEAPAPADSQSRKLVVGRDIKLKGEVTSCDTLLVEGWVEVSLPDARQIQVAESGVFVGKVEVDEADIAGRFEGELTVRNQLTVRATGKVGGHVRYGSITIEAGGQISGEVEALGQGQQKASSSSAAEHEPTDAPLPGSAESLDAATGERTAQ